MLNVKTRSARTCVNVKKDFIKMDKFVRILTSAMKIISCVNKSV